MDQANAAQLAECIGVSKRTIQKRALREAWPFNEYPVRGGMQRVYPVDLLPEDIAIRVMRRIASSKGATSINEDDVNLLSNDRIVCELNSIEFTRAKAKYALLQAALRYVRSHAKGKVEAIDEFVQRFADHKAPVDNYVYKEMQQVSRISLLRWEKRFEQSGILGLLDGFLAKVRRFDTAITEQLKHRYTGLLQCWPECNVSQAFSYFSALYPVSFLPSARRWQRLRELLLKDICAHSTEGNEQPIWEMFVFPVALRFKDVENVAVMITELQTGRHFFALVETVTEQVCDALLRKALLHWDKPEGVKVVSNLLPVSYTFQSILRACGVRCWANSRRYPMSRRSVELVRHLLLLLCESVEEADANSLMSRLLFDLVQMTDVNRHGTESAAHGYSDDEPLSISQQINMPMLDLPYTADEMDKHIAAERSSEDQTQSSPTASSCLIEDDEPVLKPSSFPRLFDGLLSALPQDCGFAEVSVHGVQFEQKMYSADWLVDYVGHVLHCRWDPITTEQVFVFTALTKEYLGIIHLNKA